MKFKYLYFILLFALLIGFVFFVSFYRLFFSKSTYIYAKVKVGQGLWWASTAKSPLWLVNSIKKGDVIKNFNGETEVEVLSVRHFPYFLTQNLAQNNVSFININQYDIFLNLKIKVSGNKINGYSFQRSTIGVGAPIDLDFPSAQISGAITELSDKPIVENFVEKTIFLTKKSTDSNEFYSIKIGQSYFDGENEVIKIIDKSFDGSNITIKALFKLKKESDQLVFGEEEILAINKIFNFITSNSIFYNFIIDKIE
ncbi:MAG: hypothetical protein WC894_02260 [Patescibacteria group bacterium]